MSELPLAGIRILDMTGLWAGPYATMLLADWGAEVIRVESTQVKQMNTRGNVARPTKEMVQKGKLVFHYAYPNLDPGKRPWNRHPSFNAHARNKLSMTVDLRRPEGKAILLDLVRIADVLIENSTPRLIQKLGLEYDVLLRYNPQLIMVRMPGFGLTGSYARYRALGTHTDGVTGHHAIMGYPDVDPTMRGDTTAADAAAGSASAFATLAALWRRRQTGEAQLVEVPLVENFLGYMAEPLMDYTMNGHIQESIGNRDPVMAPQGCYRCTGNDQWLVLSIAKEAQWKALCDVMGQPSLAKDARFASAAARRLNHDALDVVISDWTQDKDSRHLFTVLQAKGVPAGPVLDEFQLLEDPQLAARGFFEELHHTEAGTYKYHGPLWKQSETPNHLRLPPCSLGEHNEYVYKDLLCLSDARYQEMEATGHIGRDFVEGIV